MRLSQLLDMSVVQRLAEANHKASGMPIGIVDAFDGTVLVACGWQDICVRFHRAHPQSAARCRESDSFIKTHLFDTAPCEYQCRNGLRDIGIPILVAGEHLATMFLGQFFYEGETPDRAFFVRQACEFGYDEQEYLAALERVPLFRRAVVENILAYDVALSRFIADLAEGARERIAHEQERRLAMEHVAARARFPEESPDPVLRLARGGVVVYANEVARTALAALGGSEAGQLAPADILAPARDAAARGRRICSEIRSDGRVFSMTFCPVGDEVNAYGSDITERKRAEEALRRSEEQLRVATLAGEIGVWSWVRSTSELSVSANWRRLFGVASDVRVTFDTWRDAVHPGDRERALHEVKEASGQGREFNVEYRVVLPDGAVRWISDRGRAARDGRGRIVSVAGVNADITERKRAEEALRESDRRKNEFLGMLSHELRNPLAAIHNSLYVIEHAEPGDEKAYRARLVIRRQTDHLTRLVDDLLDVTRIARGKIALRRERLDISDVVRHTADDHRSIIVDRGVKLHVEVPEERVWVDGDPVRLAQVIGNLLQNAAKFTPPGGEISVSVLLGPDAAAVTVRDTGIGIEEEMLARIFEPFFQSERTLARSDGGLGLGLALVKGITELHGGAVSARSGEAISGAEFTVRLPLRGPDARPDARPVRARSTAAPSKRSRRVLVVDDNIDLAESLADVLEMLGHTVDIAYDGPGAIAKARASRPDVVLCDIGLPGMTGYEVARALRAEIPSGMQIVAVTGYAQPEDKRRAAESGFDGHLAKPPDHDELERLLR